MIYMWHETCRQAERTGSEWWNKEVGGVVAKKQRAFEKWLQRRDRVSYDRYGAQRVVVKSAIKVAKEWWTDDGDVNWE